MHPLPYVNEFDEGELGVSFILGKNSTLCLHYPVFYNHGDFFSTTNCEKEISHKKIGSEYRVFFHKR